MESFHAVPWERRLAIAESFQDPRLKALATRLIHTERPDLLPKTLCDEHDRLRARRVLGLDGDVPWLTIPKAIEEVEAMLAECEETQRPHLQEHCDHLKAWLEKANAILSAAAASAA